MTKSIVFLLLFAGLSFTIYLQIPFRAPSKQLKADNKPKFGGTYRRMLTGNPDTLDPAFVTDTTSCEAVSQMFSRLLRLDDELKIKPGIITDWRISANKKKYTFNIKRKVRFHTITEDSLLSANKGRELNAHDVKFTLERILSPKLKSPHRLAINRIKGSKEFFEGKANNVSGIRIIDNYTIEIELNAPFSPFLSILTMAPLSVVPREDVNKWGKDFALHPVGSGAFIFESFRKDQTLVLRSNLDYHKGRPYLDKIQFQIVKSDEDKFEQFIKGEVFHVESLPASRLRKIQKNKMLYKFQERSALEVTYLGMNVNLAPFDNLYVRKAINHAVNKNMIVRYIRKGRGFVAKGPLSTEIREYNSLLKAYEFDLKKARNYLNKAGFHFDDHGMVTDFPTITLQTSISKRSIAVSQAIQANLADLGIKLVLDFASMREHYRRIDSGKIAFFFLGWVADYPDADNILYYNFHSHNIGTNNSCRYNNPEVDRLLEQARATENDQSRKLIYQTAEQKIVDDAPWVFLYYPTTHVTLHSFVRGFHLSPFGSSEVDYYYVWLDQPNNSI